MKLADGVPAAVDCSVTGMKSVSTPYGRMSPCFVQNDEKPLSRSTRFEIGEVHVACVILDGASQIDPDSGDVLCTPGSTLGPDATQSDPGERHWSPPAR